MSETSHSHELHTPYSSQMLSDLHLYDTNRITIAAHTGKDDDRSSKNYIRGKVDDVIISNTSSLTSFSPFMSALELSPFLTSSGSTLSTDYVWHEENIPRFDCAGAILTNHSNDDDHYNMIPQFDGTSDEPSSSHKKPSQNHIPPVVSQHTDCVQSRSPAEHQSSRSNPEAEHPFGMSWNSGAAGRESGNPETYLSGRKTQQDVSQKWPHQQQHQWFEHQQNMPTLLLPSSPAVSIQSPTHNPHASPRQLAIPTPSPPHLQPQSPAYNSAMTSKSHQHPYQSPSHYPYLSPQSNWGFHSPHQPYKSPSANQSYQSLGETSESFQSELANKSYLSPTLGEAQARSSSYESPCSSDQSSPSKVYQTGRDQMQASTYQSSSQAHEGFQPQRYPHPGHPPRGEACDPGHSVWRSHTCSTNSQVDTHSLKSCQNSSSAVAKSHLKVHYSSNDLQAEISDCQSNSEDCMFPQDLGNKSTVTPAFCQSSVRGEAHISVQKLKPNPTLLHPLTSADRQCIVRSSVNLGNIGVSSKISTETGGIISSAPNLGQILIEESGQIHTKRDKQMAFIKKVIDSPTPPMPGQRYRDRVKLGVELLGRSRSTSLSSPVSPMYEHHTGPPQVDVNLPVAGQYGVSQTAPHPLSCESRRPSPMHSSDWQCWKEQNFLPGSQWQMHDRQSFDSSQILRGSSRELSTDAVSVGSRLQQTSSKDNSVLSSSYENSLQQNTLPLLSNTQDTFENNLSQSLQIHSSSGLTSACTAMKSEQSSCSSLHQLVSHVDSEDVHQDRTLASSVPVGFSNRNYSREKTDIPVLSTNSTSIETIYTRTQYKQESERAGSEPAGQLNSIDLSDFSYLKPENISRSSSLDSIHFQDEKEDMNKDLAETASPYTDIGVCGGETSPTYTIAFQVPTTISKNLSNANIRTDDVEVVKMRPGDAHSNNLVKIGCEVVKAVKLSEVDLEGYVGGELSPSDIIPSDGSTAQIEIDTPVVEAREHHPNDREKVVLSTFNTSFLQNTSLDQKTLKTSQTNALMSRASPTVNRLSPVDSEWMHESTDRYLTHYKQKINTGLTQSGDSHVHNLPYANNFEDFTSRQEMSPGSRSRQFDSQLPGNDSGNLFCQLRAEQDSSGVHSVSSSNKDKYLARQKENVWKSHVLHQQLPQHQHEHQCQQSPAHLPWQQRPHSKSSHPGVEVDWHPTDQHGLASRCKTETMPGNICDQDTTNNENTFGSSRLNLQRNVARSSGPTTGQQHAARSTLNQPGLGHMSYGRCESSICKSTSSSVHTKHSGGVDRLDETHAFDASRKDHLEDADDSSSSSQVSGEEDITGLARNKWPGNDASEQQLNECVSQHGEQRMKLSSRKNVKALCLTIPKPRSRTHSLDLDRRRTSSYDAEQTSSVSSHRDLADSECNSKDKFAFRRSRRCSRQEDVNDVGADGRHSPRKTTMQSAYAKSAHVLKLKKRKTAESLIEGVHYMVVGKFRGHKTMLVKTKKLNVNPTDRVKVEDFEKLAAQEVVRVVSPVSLLKSRIYAGDSESSTYPCDISESESDAYSHKPHIVYDNFSIDNPLARIQCALEDNLVISELDTVKDKFKPNRSRSRTKSKNIFTSFTKEMDESNKWSRRLKEDSKNIFTSFSKEMGEDNEWSRRLREDQFFFRFKESFIKHCKGKEDVSDFQLQDHENIFFEGVKRSSFCNFQQKFLSNIQKLKSGDYSSSSDDEDDVLDDTILKKTIGLSHRPIISQDENGVTPLKPLKLSASEGGVWNHHPDVKDAVCTFSDQNNTRRHSLESPGVAENGQEKSFDNKLGVCPALDNHIDAHNEESCHNEHINKCTTLIDRFQEEVETEKDRQLLTRHENERNIASTLKVYESEKIISIQMKGYEREKLTGSTLKGYESERCIGSPSNMENTNSSVEVNTGQSHIYHHNFHENSVVSNSSRDEEAREDYLKCQMAFFEDISSDSESNDTIIMDNCMGKGPAIQRGTAGLYPPFAAVDTCPNKLSEILNSPTEKSTLPVSSDEFKLQEDVEQKCSDMEQAEVCESMQNEPEFSASGNMHGPVLETSDRRLTQVSIPSSEFPQVFRLTSQQKETTVVNENDLTSKNMLYISQGAFEEEGQSHSTFMGDSDTEVEADISKLTHSNGSKVVNREPRSDAESVFTKTHHKKKRHRKSVKKMKKAEASSGTKGRQTVEDGNSNCQKEIYVLVDPDCQSKCLPERKKTYTYYTEDLDSGEDVSSDSSDEDFTVGSSRRKLKMNRKSKGRNITENPRKLPKVIVDSGKAPKKGQKGSSSRGRKRKAAGGDKLLSSLSLLHMATLANLTETPSDLLDQPSASETTIYMQDDSHSLYFTDNSLSSAPDEMLPYSSQYFGEEDPPFVDSKRWKLTRKRKSARESTALSKKLLKRQTNLKYGHSVASDTSQNPSSLSRLVNNCSSSSPVPSNFTFSHISDTSGQVEAANLSEDAGTNIALQLLETRRAQVNCASFSMRDILRLTTPDDSMDSDSRDSSAHARFSASKKAQVKSTTLSMSDILKLTNINSHSETGQIPISGHVLLPNTDPLTPQPADNGVDIPSHPSSLASREASRFVSSSKTEGSQISASFRSHFKQFDGDSRQLHTLTESSKADLLESSDSHKPVPEKCAKDSNIEPVSCRLVEGTRSWVRVGRNPHKKSVSDSDLLRVSSVGIHSNPDSKVKTSDTAWCLRSVNDRHAENDSEFETCVNRLDEEPHERVNISSSGSFTSSSVLPSTVDAKPSFETVSTPPALNNIVNETHTTSFSTLPHPSRLILKTSSTSKCRRDKGEKKHSGNGVGSHRVVFTATTGKDSEVTGVSSPSVNPLEEFDKLNYETIPTAPSPTVLEASVPGTSVSPVVVFTATTGKDSEVTGVSSPSVSPLEEFDKLNYETIPTVPSPTVLEASVPGTSVSPVVKTARLSGASGRAVPSQKVSFSGSEPLSTFSKQENKGNHKNMSVRNMDRGVKPLHPLQIPHYSLVDQKCHPQVGHIHNTKNSSQYYPHCWQWPVHTPGSDATVSPLNLCTSHKSPNNYSPITPTSPVSPDYPTQAQGVAEFDRSPRVKEGKPLWYPWLKVQPDRSEARLPSAQTSYYSNEEYKMQMSRSSRLPDLLPVKQSEQEGAANVFREPAQVESHRVRHDIKASLDVQKDSPSKSMDQLSSVSKLGFVKPRGALINTEAASCPGTAIDPSCMTGGESLPSTSCSETLAGTEINGPFEISAVATMNIK